MTTNFNQQAADLTGVQRLQRFEQQSTRHGMADNLGYQLSGYADGEATLTYTLKERHMNLLGSLHGGILASLLDTAMGCAVMTKLGLGERHTMTDLNTKFLSAVMDMNETLTIVGRVEHAGRRMLSTEGTIVDSQGRLVARAISSAVRL